MAENVIKASAPVPGKQSLEDAYAEPDNFLEIDVQNAQTHGFGGKRYTDYEVRLKVGQRRCDLALYHPSQTNLAIRPTCLYLN